MFVLYSISVWYSTHKILSVFSSASNLPLTSCGLLEEQFLHSIHVPEAFLTFRLFAIVSLIVFPFNLRVIDRHFTVLLLYNL